MAEGPSLNVRFRLRTCAVRDWGIVGSVTGYVYRRTKTFRILTQVMPSGPLPTYCRLLVPTLRRGHTDRPKICIHRRGAPLTNGNPPSRPLHPSSRPCSTCVSLGGVPKARTRDYRPVNHPRPPLFQWLFPPPTLTLRGGRKTLLVGEPSNPILLPMRPESSPFLVGILVALVDSVTAPVRAGRMTIDWRANYHPHVSGEDNAWTL